MKLDTHVHTVHSGRATVFPFNHFMRESYNTPASVYAIAKRRGMDLITVTDHDEISGALALGDRDDVLTGCEVTAEWPDIDLCVHLNVLDITASQHREIQRVRGDVRQLMPYLDQEGVYTSLNHVASGINGPLTAAHLAAVLPWVDGLEVINGTRLPLQNRTAMCLAAATGKHTLGGGDSHTGRGIGLTWTEVPGARIARGVHEGFARRPGHRRRRAWRHAHDDVRHVALRRQFHDRSRDDDSAAAGDWRGYAFTFGGILGLPIVPVLMAAPFVHFLHEQRFNRDLLYDLIARPERADRLVPELAA